MKKRFFLTSLLFLGGLFAVCAAEVAPEKTSLNILAIGNSFSRPLSRYLPTMARSAGCRVHFENLYIGGGSMQTHWNNIEKEEDNPEFKYFKKFSYRQKLAERKWDFVTIQQASDKSWDIETYRPYAQNLRDYVKTHASAAEVLLHQTWAYRQDDRRLKKFKLTQQTMFEKIFAANNEIGKELQLRVLPVGSAIQLARETEPVKFVPFEQQTFEYPALPSLEGSFVGDQKLRWSKDHKRVEGDAAHLNHRGEFIQACVWFAVLFNRPVSDIKFVPAEFSPEDVAFMKETAQKVVDSFEQPVRQDDKVQREMNQFEKKIDRPVIGGFPVQFPRSEDVSLRIVLRNPQGNDRFKVAIGGDVCPGKSGAEIVARGAAGEVFGELKTFLEGCNLCAVQWETPLASELSPIVKTGPKLNSPPSSVRLLEGFFSVALLANNHLGDQGPANVIETLEVLNRAGIRTVGAGRNRSEARTPLRLTQEGRRITLVNLCENEFGTATETVPGTAGQEPLEDLELVRREAAACDLLLVVLHGGHEYNPFPSPRLQLLCRAFAAAGADAVLNCHTHCPEGIEIFQGVPIVYSPGNLYFPKDARKYAGNSIWWYGFLPKFHFDEAGVFELEILPYRFDNSGVHVLPERQLEYFRQYFNRLCEVLADRKMLERYFEAWSAVRGQQYLAESLGCISATWEQELSLPKTRADLMGMRNLFCCESHHDMVRCFLRLVEQNRVKEAASLFPELQALRNAPENWK